MNRVSGSRNSHMPSAYRAIYLHIVFSTKGRKPWLLETIHPRLLDYLGGAIKGSNAVPVALGGWIDHVHLLISASTGFDIENFVKEIKRSSNTWLKTNLLVPGDFAWQRGYGVFSLSRWDIDKIGKYIREQKEHHQRISFEEEFRKLLKKHGIEFEEKYLLG